MDRILVVSEPNHFRLSTMMVAKLRLALLTAEIQADTPTPSIDDSHMIEIKASEPVDVCDYLTEEKGIGQKAKWASKPHKRNRKR